MTTKSLFTAPLTPERPADPPTVQGAAVEAGSLPKDVLRQGKFVAKQLKSFIRSHPEIISVVEGKKYPRVEAWQFVAACHGCTPLISATRGDAQEGYSADAHLENARGRIVACAQAACSTSEEFWKDQPAFAVLSMAQTRAIAKVCRSVWAWIMVLAAIQPTPAEEMPGGYQGYQGNQSSPMTGKKCKECGNQLSDKLYAQTRKKYGKPLCLSCRKAEDTARSESIMQPIAGPEFVEKSIAQVKARQRQEASSMAPVPKTSEIEPGKKQPIAELLDSIDDKEAYSL